jgi:4-hydroxythreonine-4-phosphate dehydrogenase
LSNTADRTRRSIVISMGEPSGIGPEVAVRAWIELRGNVRGRPLRLIGNSEVFFTAARLLHAKPEQLSDAIIDVGQTVRAVPGKPSEDNAKAVTEAIASGAKAAQAGEAAALVTAPIHKAVLKAAGFGFPGHTEYLASLTGAKQAVMMLSGEGLRVVPLTIHMPLAHIFHHITKDSIVAVAEIVLDALKVDFGCACPRLAVAGLNPHAGENGTLGREEIDIIAPAVAALRAGGNDVSGPLPADSMFHQEARARYDAALCLYHDQALIPLKTLAFWTAVNVTLGLPIVRTSPDHGTALAIAGRGVADARSMIAAIELADGIATRRGL